MNRSYIAVLVPNNDYLSNDRVYVDSFYEVEYVKYFEKHEEINGIWKLLNKDFSKLEERKKIPPGTIDNDLSALKGMQLRARFAVGEVILLHTQSTFSSESLHEYINTMNGEEIHSFIEKAKIT